MRDLNEIKAANEQAEQGELQRKVARLHELESILGIPATDVSGWSWPRLRLRVAQLAAIAASRLDPDDPETQTEPAYLADYLPREINPWY